MNLTEQSKVDPENINWTKGMLPCFVSTMSSGFFLMLVPAVLRELHVSNPEILKSLGFSVIMLVMVALPTIFFSWIIAYVGHSLRRRGWSNGWLYGVALAVTIIMLLSFYLLFIALSGSKCLFDYTNIGNFFHILTICSVAGWVGAFFLNRSFVLSNPRGDSEVVQQNILKKNFIWAFISLTCIALLVIPLKESSGAMIAWNYRLVHERGPGQYVILILGCSSLFLSVSVWRKKDPACHLSGMITLFLCGGFWLASLMYVAATQQYLYRLTSFTGGDPLRIALNKIENGVYLQTLRQAMVDPFLLLLLFALPVGIIAIALKIRECAQ